jgi:hypothetical protein
MFSSENIFIVIFGVLLGTSLIVSSVYFVHKLFGNNTQELLVKYILLVFTALVSVWIVDKVIAFRINLLSTAQNENLFELIKTLILMIFSYYFGTKNVKNKDE